MEDPQTQNEMPTSNSSDAAKKNKRTLLIVGGIVALLVVAAAVVLVVTQSQANQRAALLANRGFNGQFGGFNGSGDGQFGGPGGFGNFQMTPAKELPTTPADLNGFVVRVDGQSIFVGQRFGRGFKPGTTPDPTQPTATPAPDVEVIVTSDTVIYQDTTPRPDFQNGQPPSGPVTIQQQVTLSSLSALPANSRVTVWGDRSGNQLTAKVIVFTQFAPRQQPNGNGSPTG
jgi:hypothetical protein